MSEDAEMEVADDDFNSYTELYRVLTQPIVCAVRACLERPAQSMDEHNIQACSLETDVTGESSAGGSNTYKPISESDCDTDENFSNPYMCSALDAISFIIEIKGNEQKTISKSFKPQMAHQIFGHGERINGYKNLEIVFHILPNSFHTWVEIKYSNRYRNELRGEIADDIAFKLSEWFDHKLEESEYQRMKSQEDFTKMFGTELLNFSVTDENGTSIHHINVCDAAEPGFLDFHKRFQGLIVFYIDAASIIDFTDSSWSYLYLYKDIELSNGSKGCIPIGYCTIYNFAATKRSRISQMFILPNFQSRGMGSRLLGATYAYIHNQNDVIYITVESPCDAFTVMRDKFDIRMLAKTPEFGEQKVLQGFSNLMEEEAARLYKICPVQTKHIYEILRCYYSKSNPALYDDFKKYMKQEIHKKYKRKLSKINSNPDQMEKVLKLRRIVKDDCLINRRIERDVAIYIRSIKQQLKATARFLKE